MYSTYSYSNYQRPPVRKKSRKKLLFLLVLFLLLAGGTAANFKLKKSENNPIAQIINSSDKKEEAKYVGVSGKYLFSGTIVLGRAVERDARGDLNQPFSKLSTINISQYDNGIIDLECPSTGRKVSFSESVNNLIFDCHPDWFPTMKNYFQIMNIAGNHTYDAGADGFAKTVNNIQNAGMQAAGHYSPRVKNDICEVVGLKVRLQNKSGTEEVGSLPIALCTFHYQFEFQPLEGEIETIKQYAETMPVIGMMHAGAEYQSIASEHQENIARKMIDNGADFVVGNGAHYVQNTEVYKGKLIVYSTGNFIFDQIEYESRLGFSLDVDMSLAYDSNLQGWLDLGESCKTRDDDCLNQAKSKNLKKFTPTYKFSAVSTFGGLSRVTEKANAQQKADIEKRANWSESLRQLGQ